jgi:hypothetical protein
MKSFYYHILKSNSELQRVTESILDTLKRTEQTIVNLTEFVDTDVVIRNSPQNTIPELGISGQYTKDANCIDIYVDLNHDHLQANFASEIARTFIHEYMHALRENYVPWDNGTLFDSLIAEGLTQSFEIEVQPNLTPSIYATEITGNELEELWISAQPFLSQRGWDNDEWFFGGENIKRWSGYSLGFKLVQTKITESGLPASKLYKLPTVDFLPNIKKDTK